MQHFISITLSKYLHFQMITFSLATNNFLQIMLCCTMCAQIINYVTSNIFTELITLHLTNTFDFAITLSCCY